MAFTQQQYDSLLAAYAEGTLKVRYQDKEVEYRSLEQMKTILAEMELELGIIQNSNIPKRFNYVMGSEI